MSGRRRGESVDRNKAIGYLVANAMAAEVLGNKERCKAFTEAAQLLRSTCPPRRSRHAYGRDYALPEGGHLAQIFPGHDVSPASPGRRKYDEGAASSLMAVGRCAKLTS